MGFNADDIYTNESKWLKAADLKKQEHTLTIENVTLAEVKDNNTGKPQKKLELIFRGVEKTLLLNKTNSDAISYAYTPDTDHWIGKSITLYPTMVPFGDNTVEAIRVRPELQKAAAPLSQAQAESDNTPLEAYDGVEEPPF